MQTDLFPVENAHLSRQKCSVKLTLKKVTKNKSFLSQSSAKNNKNPQVTLSQENKAVNSIIHQVDVNLQTPAIHVARVHALENVSGKSGRVTKNSRQYM